MGVTFSELLLKLDVLTHDIVTANTAGRDGRVLRFVLLLVDGLVVLLLLDGLIAPVARMVRQLGGDRQSRLLLGISNRLVATDRVFDQVLAWLSTGVSLAVVGKDAVCVVLRHYFQI